MDAGGHLDAVLRVLSVLSACTSDRQDSPLGWLDADPHALLRVPTAVMPSAAENFPVALLEAISAGLAVVTSRGTGCEEVTGDTSVLVTPGDLGELRSAVLGLAADPDRCRRLGRAARARVESEFARAPRRPSRRDDDRPSDPRAARGSGLKASDGELAGSRRGDSRPDQLLLHPEGLAIRETAL
ncbi:MAG: glycosyltransferase family 4 protein, partial [Gemmatimonadota bacterium]